MMFLRPSVVSWTSIYPSPWSFDASVSNVHRNAGLKGFSLCLTGSENAIRAAMNSVLMSGVNSHGTPFFSKTLIAVQCCERSGFQSPSWPNMPKKPRNSVMFVGSGKSLIPSSNPGSGVTDTPSTVLVMMYPANFTSRPCCIFALDIVTPCSRAPARTSATRSTICSYVSPWTRTSSTSLDTPLMWINASSVFWQKTSPEALRPIGARTNRYRWLPSPVETINVVSKLDSSSNLS